jgi:hypothetical protein
MLRAVLLGAGLMGMVATSASAADTYKFTLYNHSKYPIVGFQTYENGKWDTWRNVGVGIDEKQAMDWNSNEGNCVVPFRIIYADVQTEQYQVDWCKISNIHVYNDRVTAD